MEELGIIINQYEAEMSFGKWKIRELRNDNNPEDWHTDSFMETVYPTAWFQSLNVPYDTSKQF